jgi:hypothetical protein
MLVSGVYKSPALHKQLAVDAVADGEALAVTETDLLGELLVEDNALAPSDTVLLGDVVEHVEPLRLPQDGHEYVIDTAHTSTIIRCQTHFCCNTCTQSLKNVFIFAHAYTYHMHHVRMLRATGFTWHCVRTCYGGGRVGACPYTCVTAHNPSARTGVSNNVGRGDRATTAAT